MKPQHYILLFLLSINILHAKVTCNPSGTQTEMNQCSYEDFKKADATLNKKYKELRALRNGDTPYLNKLKTSQKAWLKFRDAEVKTIFACKTNDMKSCWGSMYPLLYNIEMQTLTEQRSKTLGTYIKDYLAQNSDFEVANETQEFLILKSTKSYDEAKSFVKKMSKKLNIKIDYRGLGQHKTNFLTFDKKTCDIYGYPCYIGRGRDTMGEYLSIEHSNIYKEMTDGYYIVVAATGKDVSTNLKKVKKVVKDAYVKKLKIYMGCMH